MDKYMNFIWIRKNNEWNLLPQTNKIKRKKKEKGRKDERDLSVFSLQHSAVAFGVAKRKQGE